MVIRGMIAFRYLINNYANKNENGSSGKNECWYIMDAEEGATIVIGHNAKNKKEVESMINNKRNPQALPVVRQCVLHGQ